MSWSTILGVGEPAVKYWKLLCELWLKPGRDSTYERGGDACRKFWIKPLKETDLGVAQAFFDP